MQFTPPPLMLVECTPVSIVNYRQGVGSIHCALFSTRIVTCELTTRRSSFLYAAEERAQPKILIPQKTVVPVMRPLSRTAGPYGPTLIFTGLRYKYAVFSSWAYSWGVEDVI